MPCRPARAASLALVFWVASLGPGVTLAGEEPPPPPAKKSATATEATPDDPDAAPVRATAGGANIPVGVTLHGPRPPAAIARDQLQPGLTLLGPAPRVTWPRIFYRLSEGAPSLSSGLVPPLAPFTPGRPALRPPEPFMRVSPAAEPGTQLAPLDAPPMTAWTAFPGSVDWAPQSAFPPTDPASPYPWNPVRWSDGDWLGSAWLPVSAWPPGVSAENWSPVLWSSPPEWTDWQPRDAWDRLLEPEEGGTDGENARPAPAPSGRERQD